jgi:hypothetical protein
MKLEIRRHESIDSSLRVQILDGGRTSHVDDVYVLHRGRTPLWQVAVSWGEHSNVPFREELVWASGGVAVIGGGAAVHFLDLESGAAKSRLEVSCLFGGLALDEGEPLLRNEALYVLGWTDIIAIEPTLQRRWWARDVALDGVTFRDAAGPVIRFGVEMDPPGGWFDIEVDASTGQELSRKPAFTDGYIGIYGSGREIS